MANSINLAFGTSLDAMDEVIVCDWNWGDSVKNTSKAAKDTALEVFFISIWAAKAEWRLIWKK